MQRFKTDATYIVNRVIGSIKSLGHEVVMEKGN